MPRAPTAALIAAALLVAGCGGSGPGDKEKIETTVRDYFTAFSDSDPAKACDQLVPEARDALAKAARVKDCPAALARALQRPDVKRYGPALRNVKVLSVEISGDTATAKVRAIGSTTSVPLRKEGGAWKIEGKVGEAD